MTDEDTLQAACLEARTEGFEQGYTCAEELKDKIIKDLVYILKSCRAAMDYAYEDHADRYYLNVKESVERALSEVGPIRGKK